MKICQFENLKILQKKKTRGFKSDILERYSSQAFTETICAFVAFLISKFVHLKIWKCLLKEKRTEDGGQKRDVSKIKSIKNDILERYYSQAFGEKHSCICGLFNLKMCQFENLKILQKKKTRGFKNDIIEGNLKIEQFENLKMKVSRKDRRDDAKRAKSLTSKIWGI